MAARVWRLGARLSERSDFWVAVGALAGVVAAVAAVVALIPRTAPPPLLVSAPQEVATAPVGRGGTTEDAIAFDPAPNHLSLVEVTGLRQGERVELTLVFMGTPSGLRGCQGQECDRLSRVFSSVTAHEGVSEMSGVIVVAFANSAGVARFEVPSVVRIGGAQFETVGPNFRVGVILHDEASQRFQWRITNPGAMSEVSVDASTIWNSASAW